MNPPFLVALLLRELSPRLPPSLSPPFPSLLDLLHTFINTLTDCLRKGILEGAQFLGALLIAVSSLPFSKVLVMLTSMQWLQCSWLLL